MTWFFESQAVSEFPDGTVGFVYLITNLSTGRKYIGKKLVKFQRTTYRIVKLKNGTRKRKRIVTKIDSDWQTYYGSNEQLNQDVALLGSDNFRREILFYCNSKAQCSYLEAKEQFARQVLESDEYYNSYIQVRVHSSHLQKSLSLKLNTDVN